MPSITISEPEQTIEIQKGELILSGCLTRGLVFGFACGGIAACGTCLVKIHEGLDSLLPRNQKEDFMAKAMLLEPEYRLGCQTAVGDHNLSISIPSLEKKRSKP